jgi:hypothetical protein
MTTNPRIAVVIGSTRPGRALKSRGYGTRSGEGRPVPCLVAVLSAYPNGAHRNTVGGLTPRLFSALVEQGVLEQKTML